jgi:prepilin-type processing-associated H-X9-DG protein
MAPPSGQPDSGNWQNNGPNYIASTWDGIGNRVVTINSFTDGTSNTAIFSEWVKGSAASPGKNNLGEVYYFPGQLNTDAFSTDFQFNQACQIQPINANQAQHWKGEWWAYAPSQIYSHTVTPNRYCCEYSDQNPDGRATITAQNASSNHPGGVNVLFMDGSVRFIKTSVSYIPWYAIATPDNGEVIGSDQL